MTSGKSLNGLQDLMRHLYCRRAILTRYHRSRTSTDCVKKRFKLELQGFFFPTLELLNLDGRLLSSLNFAPANDPLPSLEIH